MQCFQYGRVIGIECGYNIFIGICNAPSFVVFGCRYSTYIPVTVAKWLQWLACLLPTGRHWLRLGSNPCGSVGGVSDHT